MLFRSSASDICDTIVQGALAAFGGALIIGLARSVQWVMTQGGLVDPLVHGLTSMMSSASSYLTSVFIFIVNFFINALIPSGSGQAMAVMPIMIPMADMLHIDGAFFLRSAGALGRHLCFCRYVR